MVERRGRGRVRGRSAWRGSVVVMGVDVVVILVVVEVVIVCVEVECLVDLSRWWLL